MKTTLSVSISLIALTAGSAVAAQHSALVAPRTAIHHVNLPPGMLYNQNSNFGVDVNSQNFTSGGTFTTNYNDSGADDFIVPSGQKWMVNEVDVTGVYFNGSGPASSVVVTFYKNRKGHPNSARIKAGPYTVNCVDSAGSFACTIPRTKLGGGSRGKRYWVSVVANCSFVSCGKWGWTQNTSTHNDPGQWENPGGAEGTSCQTWGNTSTCFHLSSDDWAFDLVGKN